MYSAFRACFNYILVAFLVVLQGFFLALPGHAQKGVVYLEMRYDPPRITVPLIRISVNGKTPENFLLDTGAGYPLILTKSYVKRAKLPQKNDEVMINGSARMTLAKVNTLHLIDSEDDRIPLEGLEVALVTDTRVEASAPGQKVAGIIGIGLFSAAQAEMDFKAQRLILYNADAEFTPPRIKPLLLTPRDGGVYTAFLSPDIKTAFLIDTGAYSGGIDQEILDLLPQIRTRDTSFWKVEGLYLGEEAQLESFTVSGISLRKAAFDGLPSFFRVKESESLVGMEVLQNFRLVFDIPHKQLYVEPNPDPRFQRSYTTSGASLTLKGKSMRVERVEPGSPAAGAGLKEGDEVISVDKIPVSGEAVFGIQILLDGVEGEEAHVEIKRGTKQVLRFLRTKSFKSQLTDNPCFTGLIARMILGKPLEIFRVKPDSPFFLAGVREGDEITAINGKALSKQTMETMIELMKPSQVELTVRGKNGPERTLIVRASTAVSQ